MRTTDGFVLAEVDMELRGEGNVLAARQSGLPDLRHARLRRHRRLAANARTDALRMLDHEADAATESLLDAETTRIFGTGVSWAAEA